MYKVKEDLKPTNLFEISQEQIDDHWNLYVGYVNNVNKLEKIDRHRYGFEYNGMVLHELYFENLKRETPLTNQTLKEALLKTWGSFENWQQNFVATGKTRGIGWAILYKDQTTNKLINNFIFGHELGHIATFKPILVMDVWEHAYMVDHKSSGRSDYVDAFMNNVNWDVVQERFAK